MECRCWSLTCDIKKKKNTKQNKNKIRRYKTIHTFTKRIEDKANDNDNKNNNDNSISINNNTNNNDHNNNNDNVIIKLLENAKITRYYLSRHQNKWACSKNIFFLTKIPKLNVTKNQNKKSMFLT